MVHPVEVRGGMPRDEYRVHVAALGFEELDRVLEPLRMMRADAFFLLQYPTNDRAAKRYEDGGVDVLKEVRALGLEEVDVWPVNLWNAAEVGNFLGHKVAAEGFGALEVNISTGPKTVGVGATLASLFWPIHLYYADLDYTASPRTPLAGPPVRGIQRIPTFRSRPLPQDALATLELIQDADVPIRAHELKRRLREAGIIHPKKRKSGRKGSDFSAQAIHSQYQTLITPLRDQALVVESMQGGRRAYRISDQGRATLALLRGIHGG